MALTRDQLLERRRFLGSSDIPAVAKLSRWKGPHHVWMQKVQTSETCPLCKGDGCDTCDGEGSIAVDTVDDGMSEAAEIGDAVEEPLARIYERRSKRSIRKVRTSAIHPVHEWAAAMPDFEADDGGPDVEIKMVGARMLDEWGDGDDEIPADYYAQVTWQMLCRGKRSTHVVANLGGTQLRVYEIEFNERLASELVDVGREFWFEHVVPKVPPPIDGTASARAFLERRFPEAARGIVQAPFEALGIVHELRELKATIKDATSRKEELETLLKGLIADAEGIEDPSWGSATWKRTASNGIDWKAIAEHLPTETLRALVSEHTRPGYRRLHVSAKTKSKKGAITR